MSTPLVWRFMNCEVHEYPDAGENGHLVTIFRDGTTCGAERSSEMQNVDYARHLGYDTVRAALREHELAHTFVAEKLGFRVSPTLWAVAHHFASGTAPYELQLAEEAAVLGFQRYMMTEEIGLGFAPHAWRAREWAEEFRGRFVPSPPPQHGVRALVAATMDPLDLTEAA